MARKHVTEEQYNTLIERVFTHGHVVLDSEYEIPMYRPHLGYFYNDGECCDEEGCLYLDVPMEVSLSEDDILGITCIWQRSSMNLQFIQKKLGIIMAELIPGMELFPKCVAPDINDIDVKIYAHKFVYVFPRERRLKTEKA